MTNPPSLIPRGVPDEAEAASRTWNLRSSAVPFVALVALGLGALEFANQEWRQDQEWRQGGTILSASVLHAGSSSQTDFDLDGLSNDAEFALGTSETLADTDGDGYGDLEEFARHSDPNSASSTPLPAEIGFNLSACGTASGMRLQIAGYFEDHLLENKVIQVGVVINGEPRFLPWLLQQQGVEITRWPAASGENDLVLIEAPFSESMVHQLGEVSIFTVLSIGGSPTIVAAAGIDVASHEGILMLVQPAFDERIQNAVAQQNQHNPYASQGPSAGSVYRPIPTGGGTVPNTWNPGEICYQATIEVNHDNGVVTHEVMAADCISGWDAHCRSDCSSSVGEVFQTFDPLGLVGG